MLRSVSVPSSHACPPLPLRAAANAQRASRLACRGSNVVDRQSLAAVASSSSLRAASSRPALSLVAPSSTASSSRLHRGRQQQQFNSSSFSKLVVASASASSTAAVAASSSTPLQPKSVSVVLLCGGSGKRMGASIPKQYLELCGRPIVAWSLRLFASMPEVRDVVVVCEPEYKDLISSHWDSCVAEAKTSRKNPSPAELKWALPGAERQDSVQSGLAGIDASTSLVAVHDSARPLATAEEVRACLGDALEVGAAVLGVPVKPTIKEVNDDGTVARTLVRARLWEVQTPQVIEPALLRRGFEFARERNLEVTDDVSVVELLGETVRITQGRYTNIKVTTPDDMSIAERFLVERGDVAATDKVGTAAAAA